MKKLLIYCFIISPFWLLAQVDSTEVRSSQQGLMIGVDLFNPIVSAFSDKKGFEAMIAVPIKKRWNVVAEVGYEQNHFDNNNWDVNAKGVYARAGVNWFVSQDNTNPNMGYYFGGRIGFSPFQQTINKYVIQGVDMPNVEGSLPQHNASAAWLEPLAGGRVQVFNTPFYVDANVRLKIKLFDTNEEDLTPLIIPGFGTNNNGLNFGVNWSLGYVFSF